MTNMADDSSHTEANQWLVSSVQTVLHTRLHNNVLCKFTRKQK